MTPNLPTIRFLSGRLQIRPATRSKAAWSKAETKETIHFVAQHWIAQVEDDLKPTTEWLIEIGARWLRGGKLLDWMKVIEGAERDDDLLCYRSLMLAFHKCSIAEKCRQRRCGPMPRRAELRPAPHRKRGGNEHEHLLRNFWLATLAILASIVYGLQLTRNRETRRHPSGVSLIVKAARLRGIAVAGESRFGNLMTLYGPLVVEVMRRKLEQGIDAESQLVRLIALHGPAVIQRMKKG